jgi:hypothetical protein
MPKQTLVKSNLHNLAHKQLNNRSSRRKKDLLTLMKINHSWTILITGGNPNKRDTLISCMRGGKALKHHLKIKKPKGFMPE